MNKLRALVLVAEVVFFSVCAFAIYRIDRKVELIFEKTQKIVEDADTAVVHIDERSKDISQNANAALLQIGLTADEARRASIEQRQLLRRSSAHIEQATLDLDHLVLNADAEINSKTLPETTALLADVRAQIVREGDDVHRTLAAVEKTAADPKIQQSTANIAAITENTAKMTKDGSEAIHALVHPSKPQQAVSGITLLLRILSATMK